MKAQKQNLPASGLAGLKGNLKNDALAGFLVFLIALPLCLAISKASGFPPVAGIITAVIGGLLVTFLGGSELTIKGPAAGLIVIAVGAVEELGKGDPMAGYKLALAVVVVAGMVQVLFGVLRSGVLSDFFPSAAIHGMMAAIGISIVLKQLFIVMGVKPESKEALDLVLEIPQAFTRMNPEIFIIGLVSLLILFLFPLVKNKTFKKIPAPLVVIMVAIPLGRYFDLSHEHTYLFLDNHNYTIGPKFLVALPDNLLNAIVFPDFSQITSLTSIKYVVMFALVGSLESLLSTKAVDMLDPYKRKSNMNRDLIGIGIGNTLAGLIGGLPMISEIVRSSANVNNGAQTRWANFFHGLFLLVFVAFAAALITQIPVAALAAMLIYTGFRLASPKEFAHTYHKGAEQLLIFLITIVVTLATDLLLGIAAGIVAKLIIHLFNGLPLRSIFKPLVEVRVHDNEEFYQVYVTDAAVFSNYLSFKKYLDAIPRQKHIVINFSEARLVDHTVMEHLHHYENDYVAQGGKFEIVGLHQHKPVSLHPLAARRLGRHANANSSISR
jgi:MFS superfamily sulfate permease-like transporter